MPESDPSSDPDSPDEQELNEEGLPPEPPKKSEAARFFSALLKVFLVLGVVLILLVAIGFGLLYMVCGRK